jgi:hypothetical protein
MDILPAKSADMEHDSLHVSCEVSLNKEEVSVCGILLCVGHIFSKDTKCWMWPGAFLYSLCLYWLKLNSIAGRSKPVQQYMFIKFTVVLLEDLLVKPAFWSICSYIIIDLFTGPFSVGLLKKVMYIKTPCQHGIIPRKLSKMQCQPY